MDERNIWDMGNQNQLTNIGVGVTRPEAPAEEVQAAAQQTVEPQATAQQQAVSPQAAAQQAAETQAAAQQATEPQPTIYAQPVQTMRTDATLNGEQLQAATNPPEPKEKKKSGMTWGKTIAAAMIIGVMAGGAFKGVDIAYNKLAGKGEHVTEEKQTVDNVESVSTVSENGQTVVYDVSEMAKEVMPSIVSITTKSIETIQSWFQRYQQEVEGSGSGIIIRQDKNNLYVLTNYHVVKGAKSLTVTFADNTMIEAVVKGYNEDADLAVVDVDLTKISSDTMKKIKVAVIGDSDAVTVGEPAIAIGNALGYGQSLTGGFISATGRNIDTSTLGLIQTDAAINPGNSGGALLNAKGEVIGVNSSKLVDSKVEGMGFAIPINEAMALMEGVMDGTAANVDSKPNRNEMPYDEYGNGDGMDPFEYFFGNPYGGDDDSDDGQEVVPSENKAFLGIAGTSVTEEYSEYLNMPQGVYITQVTSGSPAAKAGLQAGDVIVNVDGRDYSDMTELKKYIGEKNPGDTIKITYKRKKSDGSYSSDTVDVTLEKNPNVQ